MFTGIVEQTGIVVSCTEAGTNRDFWIAAPGLTQELKIDQSVAHNGVCLTVVAVEGDRYRVTAVEETLRKTTLGAWREGQSVNLERALRLGDRLDGHFVQGHVDATAACVMRREGAGSWLFGFRFPEAFAPLVIEKGSICLDGVSLTVFDVGRDELTVTIIPYTYGHTGFQHLQEGDSVNVEFDALGKYFLRSARLGGAFISPSRD